MATAAALFVASSLQAQSCAPKSFPGAWKGEVTLCQNWDAEQQDTFWFLSQGSLVIPYNWFLALEQTNSTNPFRDGDHMDRYRYLPQKPTALRNPTGYPSVSRKTPPAVSGRFRTLRTNGSG